MNLVSLNQFTQNKLSQMAPLSSILRKLRLFNSGLLLQMSKNCRCSLISATIMVALCPILQKQLPLFMLFFLMRFLGIIIKLRGLLCTLYELYYAAILFLPCLTLPNHCTLKVMYRTLLSVVYLDRSMYMFINPLPSSARA